MLLLSVLPVALAAVPSLDSPVKTGVQNKNDAAVVVGLEDYAFVPDVPYARRDAQAFQDWLVYTRGVPLSRVQVLTSGSVEMMRTALERAGQEAGPQGVVWVYFAGHGAMDPNGTHRLLLGDDVRSDPSTFAGRGLPVDQVRALAGRGGAQVVLVADACYNGLGRGQGVAGAGTRMVVPDFAVAASAAPATGLEWTAAGPQQMASPYARAEHGAFTYFLLGAMRGWADGEITGRRDNQVTAEEAQAFVVRALREAGIRDQGPVLSGSGLDGWVLARGSGLEKAPARDAFKAEAGPAASAPPPAASAPSASAFPAAPPSTPTQAVSAPQSSSQAAWNGGGDPASWDDLGACLQGNLVSLMAQVQTFYSLTGIVALDLSQGTWQVERCGAPVAYRAWSETGMDYALWAVVLEGPSKGRAAAVGTNGMVVEAPAFDAASLSQSLALPGWLGVE